MYNKWGNCNVFQIYKFMLEDEPLKFTVKNAHGAMKTYTFKTVMVWELNAAVVKNSIKAIWVDGVLTAMPGTGKINIRNGAEVKIQVNTEAGKKLSGFTGNVIYKFKLYKRKS